MSRLTVPHPPTWKHRRYEACSRVTSSPAPELPDDEKDTHFLTLFGTTRDQVRAEGIDPDEYAVGHIREAMKNNKIAAQMLAPSAYARRLELRWLWRGWVAIFVGFAFLLLSLVKHLHVIAVALVCIDLLVVIAFSVVGWRYWLRYVRATRTENIRSWGWHMGEQRRSKRPKR
jgi:hypothetical protein